MARPSDASEVDATQRAWVLTEAEPLVWRHQDGTALVYARGSGDTHRLPALHAAVVGHLETAAASPAALAARLHGVSADEVVEILRALAVAGLAEPRTT